VVQGTEEITRGLDIVPSTRPENLRRLDAAVRDVGAKEPGGREVTIDEHTVAARPMLELETEHGELKIVPQPIGTRGYDDLRRAATRESLGRGVRPSVASIGDLARMVSSLADEERIPQLMQLRRLVELERVRERVIER
jgi:hypothetical protein